ncbi:hypothetical protein LCGC14_2482320 [marine sediment metagenome]|uniref:Uncharacterized protein n=1 Tax=marine sediment metagenome TaxID=412755 RepID=A0A0F9DJ81_9ZZZZ
MIAVGQHVHVIFRHRDGSTVFLVRVERIDYERQEIWTGKVWMKFANCVPCE